MNKQEIQFEILSQLDLSNKGKEMMNRFRKSLTITEEIEDLDFISIIQIRVLETLLSWGCQCELSRSDYLEINKQLVELNKEIV